MANQRGQDRDLDDYLTRRYQSRRIRTFEEVVADARSYDEREEDQIEVAYTRDPVGTRLGKYGIAIPLAIIFLALC